MMNNKSLVLLTEENIRRAMVDYGRHTTLTAVLDDVSDVFISNLAYDSIVAKADLRNLFRTSPAWDENLQALVINGTRTHNPDYEFLSDAAHAIFRPFTFDAETNEKIERAIKFFTRPADDPTEYITAINALAPKAYAPNKKPSRIFKAICDSLGVTDKAAGNHFQKLFTKNAL